MNESARTATSRSRRRPSGSVLLLSVLVTISLVAACTSSDPDSDPADDAGSTTEATVGSTPAPEVGSLVAETIGDETPTQDFHLVSDIERVDDDGEATSVYAQVLDAVTATDEPIPVGDGFLSYAPATGLTGRVVDASGEPVPGAVIGLGLLELSDHVDDDAALSLLDPDGSLELEATELRDEPVIVMYTTTGTEDGPATLIVPGDQFELDLTFVDELAPGDTVRETVVFGQALATPDEADTDMDADETFTHRFTSGSVATLADVDGQPAVGVSERVAVEGSTLTRRQIKILKFAPQAVVGSALVVGGCYLKVRRGRPLGNVVGCLKTVQSTIDKVKRRGKEDNLRNRRPPPCQVGCGGANGDVHLRTFDGTRYDLQAAGEFVAARSDVGHELQLRMAPWRDRDDVSVNTAVAAHIDGGTLAIQLVDGEVDLFIDGAPASLPRGSFLPVGDGGAVADTGDTFMILWADGVRVDVRRSGNHLDVTADAAAAGDVAWEGLMGDRDGARADDLALADGTVIDRLDVATIHGEFADAWRVADTTSLFHYEAGESTDTFTDQGFPRERASLETFDPAARAEAQAMCTDYGIADRVALDACTLDLALTGDPAFLVSAADLEYAAALRPSLEAGPSDDAGVGELAWVGVIDGVRSPGPMHLVRDTLVVQGRGDEGDVLVGLDATSGLERWRMPGIATGCPATVAGDLVVAMTSDDGPAAGAQDASLVAIDAESGVVLPSPRYGGEDGQRIQRCTAMTTVGDVVVHTANGRLRGFGARELTSLWERRLSGVASPPPIAASDEEFWVAARASDTTTIELVDVTDGSRIGSIDQVGSVPSQASAAATGTGDLLLAIRDGDTRITRVVSGSADRLTLRELVEASALGTINRLSADDTALYVYTGDDEITAFALADGSPLWQSETTSFQNNGGLVLPLGDEQVLAASFGGAYLEAHGPAGLVWQLPPEDVLAGGADPGTTTQIGPIRNGLVHAASSVGTVTVVVAVGI